MSEGDYIFGISPSGMVPRRILFGARVAEKMTFRKAHARFPALRGPAGPIHVRPAKRAGLGFPDALYQHIPGANHENDWCGDLQSPELDAFFACDRAADHIGCWLGVNGPPVTGGILDFLRTCSVHGKSGQLSRTNAGATETAPIRYGKLYRGLHLETSAPEELLELLRTALGGSAPTGPAERKVRNARKRSRRRC